MIHIASYLLLVAALIILIKKSRDPQERAVFVMVFRDRNAIAFGGVWTIGDLVTDFVSNGFRGVLNGLVGAMVIGFVGAAVFHSLSRRRNAANS
ncbi:hypothetical protein GALL_380350 [mine drainage metagenome]|uniref:Uncharacterized protein n=1 Tax=mine drainage metagenome TaxID=410659 RepID=A0A1J5Q9B2_9ZZZZ